MTEHWFEELADHMGSAYLRYSFTRGTQNEVGFLVETLGLTPGMRVLDVGCGPGRHAHALAERGIEVVGVDISQKFVDLATAHAPAGASFVRADARNLEFDAEFDAAISLCQGAFGMGGGPAATGERTAALEVDLPVMRGITRALRPGAPVAVSAFSAYFQVRWLEDHDHFDVDAGVNCEITSVRDPDGTEKEVRLWTSCFTPRELRLFAARCDLEVQAIYGVTPGAYGANPPSLDHPEFLLVARRDTMAP